MRHTIAAQLGNYTDRSHTKNQNGGSHCHKMAFFWTTVKKWLKHLLGLSIDEEIEEGLLFNNPGKYMEAKVGKLILLNVKFYIYIYRQRLFHKIHLGILEWALEFREKLRIEKNRSAVKRER